MNFMPKTTLATPAPDNDKRLRMLKERQRRSRESDAYKNLRHALESADPNAFWRMEKVDIVEGALAIIQKHLAGEPIIGSTTRSPTGSYLSSPQEAEAAAAIATHLNPPTDRTAVERKRRGREADAIAKLRSALFSCNKDALVRDKVEVLSSTASYIHTYLKSPKCSPTSSTKSSPIYELPSPAAAAAAPSPAHSSDSGCWSDAATMSDLQQQLAVAFWMQLQQQAEAQRLLQLQQLAAAFLCQPIITHDEPTAKRSKPEHWRPWD